MKNLYKLLATAGLIISISLASNAQADYSTAVGVRAAWGFALTGKKFISDKAAIEGIVHYRRYGFLSSFSYNRVTLMGLYQHHESLGDVLPGLSVYYGGGAFVGFYGGSDWDDFNGRDDGATWIGIAVCGGLDYKFEDLPLNISFDWMPSVAISGYNTGFQSELGGIAIRYVLN